MKYVKKVGRSSSSKNGRTLTERVFQHLVAVVLVLATLGIERGQAEICRDRDGNIHQDKDYYYEDQEHRCIINQCINGEEVIFKNKCKDDTDKQCIDSEGISHRDGEKWWETLNKPCKRHRCYRGRILLENTVACPAVQPHCQYREVAGQCCQQLVHCQVDTPEQKPCVINNQTYQHNETWGDTCTVHFCNNGRIISQHPVCPEPLQATCAPVDRAGSCCVDWRCTNTKFDGTCTLNDKEMLCFRPHTGSCRKTERTVLNHCCPVYKCYQECRDSSGNLRAHGSKWTEGCSMFSCHDGTVQEQTIRCGQAENPHCRRINPDQCCPEFDCDCDHRGQHYTDGQVWKHHCNELQCQHGHVETTRIECPPPPRDDCTPEPSYGDCCPTYVCSCAARLCQAKPVGAECEVVGKSEDKCCDIFSCQGDCLDDRGREHRNGDEWFIECKKYQCINGTIQEKYMSCPEAPNGNCHAIYLPDKCCPLYDCPPEECIPGETSFDGCNHCQCVDPGLWLCTRRACEEKPCIDSTGTHAHGTTWTHPHPCQVNMCGFGTIISKLTICPPAPGPLCAPIAHRGQCCPEWNCAAELCPENFTETTWEDECNVCTCHGNVPLCTEHICPRQCMVNGVVYHSGMEVIGDQRCDTGVCVNGLVVDNTEECYKPPFNECQVYMADLTEKEKLRQPCCPNWHCPQIPGWPQPCVPGTIHQSDTECLFCQCTVDPNTQQPRPLCTKRDCTKRHCIVNGVHYEHGEIWATVNPCKRLACVNGEPIELEHKCNKPDNLSDICRPIKDKERCCPVYHCSESCQEGETWMSNCNACYCKQGIPVCTKKECPECEEGEVWQHGCNNCTCVEGRASCTEIACLDVPCTEGEEKVVECNQCVCLDGEYMCSNEQCDGYVGLSSQCPSSPATLVAPGLHQYSRCTSDVVCRPGGGASRCCHGHCRAADNKPGHCPIRSAPQQSQCQYKPGINCHADHQCPDTYKCCHLYGCSGLCVSPTDGSVLRQ